MVNTVSLLHERSRRKPWVVRWYGEPDETGKQRRYGKCFRYAHEAKAFYAKKRADLDRGERRDPVDVTLEELVADFEEARLRPLSYASQIGYRNTIDQMLAYFGRQRKVRDIDRRHAEAFIATRGRQDGRTGELSGWAKARHVIHCRAIFTAAVAWEYVDDNPFRADRLRGQSSLRVNPKAKPWQHITPEEFRRFIKIVPTPQKRAAYWLMYGCGWRSGEAFNIMLPNVDLHRRRVHVVNRAPTPDVPPFRVKAEGQASESKERSVPIPEAAIPDLTEAMRTALKSGGFVALAPERFERVQEYWRLCREGKGWAGHAHRPWQNRDMMNNVLRDTKNLLRRAGIALTAPFTLHTFRKSFAQNHADAGTPPRTLAKLLGHANTRVTMQFYSRVTDANERAAGEAMDRLLTASATGEGPAACDADPQQERTRTA